MTYIIESIRNISDGSPHEREARRKGHRVELLQYEAGSPMLICYRDDRNSILQTSNVVSVLGTYCGTYLKVATKNTVYTFTKEAAGHREENNGA